MKNATLTKRWVETKATLAHRNDSTRFLLHRWRQFFIPCFIPCIRLHIFSAIFQLANIRDLAIDSPREQVFVHLKVCHLCTVYTHMFFGILNPAMDVVVYLNANGSTHRIIVRWRYVGSNFYEGCRRRLLWPPLNRLQHIMWYARYKHSKVSTDLYCKKKKYERNANNSRWLSHFSAFQFFFALVSFFLAQTPTPHHAFSLENRFSLFISCDFRMVPLQ